MTIISTVSIPPQALLCGDPTTSNTAGVGVATTVYFTACDRLAVPVTLTNIRVRFGSGGAGHYDVGIYSDNNGAPNALLAHAASSITALATATGAQSPALIGGNLSLQAGKYWLALWIDNATDTINRVTGAANMTLVQSGTNAGPLPAAASSVTGLADVTFKPILIGLLLNGWS